jgi:predicted RNase H-like HicB family nuclease
MRCTVTLHAEGGGIVARCREYPECAGQGPSATEALAHLRRSILFWLESCPCDQTADPGLVLEVVDDRSGSTPRPR